MPNEYTSTRANGFQSGYNGDICKKRHNYLGQHSIESNKADGGTQL
jgi:hypothetical protein